MLRLEGLRPNHRLSNVPLGAFPNFDAELFYDVKKRFYPSPTFRANKLECLSPASSKVRAYLRVKHFTLGYAPALLTNIRLGWKSLPGTNTLAYYENSKITDGKSFITLTPGPFGNTSLVPT